MNVVCIGILVMVCQFPDQPKPTSIVCPPVVEWSQADQIAAARELNSLPKSHPLRKMAVAAVKQRDVVRACQKARK